jgi:hypothetical protein
MPADNATISDEEANIELIKKDLTEKKQPRAISVTVISIHPEKFRVAAYLAFWGMVLIAYIITNSLVPTILLENSALIRTFGYNNICLNWDYAPSLWISALLYPAVEIPLLTYVFLNWLRQKKTLEDERGATPKVFYLLTFMTIIEFVLFAWFRMIFVNRGFTFDDFTLGPTKIDTSNNLMVAFTTLNQYSMDNIGGHTAPFTGLQIAMAINALQNYYFHSYHSHAFSGRKRVVGRCYVLLLMCVTIVKQSLTWATICQTLQWNNTCVGAIDVSNETYKRAAKFLDILWMLLVAVVPFFLSIYLLRITPPLVFRY